MSEADRTPAAPLVTVSMVTFNGMRWLPGCLASLERQTLRGLEVLVLDNASTDGSIEWLNAQLADHPWLSLEASHTNVGFAAAQNRNIFRARGEFVCLLNQDVELDARFLEHAVAAFAGRPRVGAVQGRLLRQMADGTRSDIIDSAGLEMHRSRRVVARGQGLADGYRYAVPGPVWGADGPAPVYRRSALIDAREPRTGGGWEVLDEDFFMYKEDVDLAWRLRRLGWQSWYQPQAVAWHARGAASPRPRTPVDYFRLRHAIPTWIQTISWRNHRLMQIKNEQPGEMLRDLPWIATRELASFGLMLVADPRRLSAIPATLRLTRAALRKRRWLNRTGHSLNG
jgi:Predicted glycosyltransferases